MSKELNGSRIGCLNYIGESYAENRWGARLTSGSYTFPATGFNAIIRQNGEIVLTITEVLPTQTNINGIITDSVNQIITIFLEIDTLPKGDYTIEARSNEMTVESKLTLTGELKWL